jgi:hypothetical protein
MDQWVQLTVSKYKFTNNMKFCTGVMLSNLMLTYSPGNAYDVLFLHGSDFNYDLGVRRFK